MRKILFKTILLIIALSSCLHPSVFAQGTLSGTVKDDGSGMVSYANVYILGTTMGAASDVNGKYNIADIPAGTYSVRASSVGYGNSTQEVTIASGQISTLDFTLAEDQLALEELIVTGVVNPQSALQSSVSISTLNLDKITQASPTNTAEIFRSIPGIRSEASGGDGNTNITARGVPIATGGSKYLLLQEDGLPVLQFGDIAFATQDIFLRADNTINRIEALRGGSASTLASNSPAGIINFISKTGEIESGSIATTVGLDYNNFRTDFEYGSPIGNNVSFHIGGFFRQGDGPRDAHFISNYGGQIKANVTKRFDSGYTRFYFKYLNDRSAAYMPMPMLVTGTNDNPTWGSVPGYDASSGTLQSPALLNVIGTGPDGTQFRTDVADGMHPVSTAIGNESSFSVGDGWEVTNRSRMAFNHGRFVAPFPAQVADADVIAQSIAGGNYALSYAATGEAFPVNANGNNLLMRMHLFNTELNNFNNFTNDLNITKSFGKVDITLGYYKAYQTISMSWIWNTYLMDVTDAGAQLVNISNQDTLFTDNGLLAYGVPFWGNCCHRNYDTKYDISAPYGAVAIDLSENLTADISARFDIGNVDGSFSGGDGQTSTIDVDGNGSISLPEENVATIDNANTHPVNYDYSYASYSIGLNYLLNNKQSIFGRYSSGGRANADRLLFGPYIAADGSATADLQADMVSQAELGYKYKNATFAANATLFLANTEEQNYEATTQKSVNREYQAIGLEIDAVTQISDFNIGGGLTFTNAEITNDELDSSVIGNTPRRQAAVIFNIVPSYTFGKNAIGISVIGTTSSYAQDNNQLIMPGYAYINAFINISIVENLGISLHGNNLLNQIGVTESEEGAIVDNTENILRARSIAGRSIAATLKYSF